MQKLHKKSKKREEKEVEVCVNESKRDGLLINYQLRYLSLLYYIALIFRVKFVPILYAFDMLLI